MATCSPRTLIARSFLPPLGLGPAGQPPRQDQQVFWDAEKSTSPFGPLILTAKSLHRLHSDPPISR